MKLDRPPSRNRFPRNGALAPILAAAVLAVAGAMGVVRAQETDNAAVEAVSPAPAEPAEAPPSPSNTAADQITPPGNIANMAPILEQPAAPAPKAPLKPAVPEKPPEPPAPVRSPVAILQALDKVTAETIRFAAPVGRKVRYKNLVFTVMACETRDPDAAEPRPAAYLVIDSAPPVAPGGEAPAPKQIFSGWMFAASPDLNPLEHPIYDAWLIACSAAAPPA